MHLPAFVLDTHSVAGWLIEDLRRSSYLFIIVHRGVHGQQGRKAFWGNHVFFWRDDVDVHDMTIMTLRVISGCGWGLMIPRQGTDCFSTAFLRSQSTMTPFGNFHDFRGNPSLNEPPMSTTPPHVSVAVCPDLVTELRTDTRTLCCFASGF